MNENEDKWICQVTVITMQALDDPSQKHNLSCSPKC